jgi:glycosyltransferase involved in cell wall biosynthesis
VTAFRTHRVQTRADAVDVLHYAVTNPVPRVHTPTVVTLDESQHRDLPERFDRSRRSFRQDEHDAAVHAAEAVVVPSEFVRERTLDRHGVGGDRVHVIPPGVNHTLFRPGDDEREPFLLYPARAWPHKNHARLFEAFAQVRERRPELGLVLTGWDKPAPDGVEARGRVPTDELVRLYRTAAALVFPSLYEGFGQPPLEAMACGCPVACSNAASLPEVVDGAARLFDPESVEDMASAIEEVLDAPEKWSQRGLERAKQFSWDECARRHEDVYRELMA